MRKKTDEAKEEGEVVMAWANMPIWRRCCGHTVTRKEEGMTDAAVAPTGCLDGADWWL